MNPAPLLLCLSLAVSLATAQNLTPNQPPHMGQALPSKKGVCLVANPAHTNNWQGKVQSLNASWHYSWGPSLPGREPDGVEFVPMIWGYHGAHEKFLACMAELTAAKTAHLRENLLGLNEPDGKEQANLSVAQALEAWPYLMQTGLRLGSPATVHADNAWMREFMQQAELKKYRVDFVCVHWYGGANAQELIKHLTKIHELYGKPIWVTEFAVADWKAASIEKNRYSPQAVLQFMQTVLPQLDQMAFVERYAWFSGASTNKALGNAALFQPDGALTTVGQFYASYAGPKPRP